MKTMALADGRQIGWRERGEGPAVILLHGWGMSSAIFTEALEALSDRFRVLAPDLRGHGISDSGSGYGLDDFASDLRQWIDALGLSEVRLLGWSLGGEVALTLLPSLRCRVDRLALVSTTPCFTVSDDWHEGLPSAQVRAMARDLKRNLQRAMGDFFMLQFDGETRSRQRLKEILDFSVRNSSLPPLDVALEALETLRTSDLRHLLPEIDCPTLVMHGLLDRIVPPGAAEKLSESLPQGRLRVYEGVGHAPFLSCPDMVFQEWRDFFWT